MQRDRRTILFVREVAWKSFFPISTRILAEEFLKDGWNVIWITPPLMPWQRRKRLLHREQLPGIFYGDNLFAFTPQTFIPFSRHAPLDRPFLAQWTWRACWPSIPRVFKQAGLPEPDVLWLSHFTARGIVPLFPGRPVLFHVTDNYAHLPSSPATCKQMERANYHAADHIIATSPTLKTLLEMEYGVDPGKVTVILHGVDLDRFSGTSPAIENVEQCPSPRLVALGNTTKLDFDILQGLSTAFPEGSVVILGPVSDDVKKWAEKQTNIFALGGIDPQEVPAYLAACDVGLVLYGKHIKRVAQDICPMKYFEYAAAGLPVVSTPLPIYNALNAPVTQVETPDEAVIAVRAALARAEELRPQMKAFARQHSWSQRYQQAKQIVESVLGD